LSVSIYAFAICSHKSCAKNIDEIDVFFRGVQNFPEEPKQFHFPKNTNMPKNLPFYWRKSKNK